MVSALITRFFLYLVRQGTNDWQHLAGRRTAIRQAWKSAAPSNVTIKFVLYTKENSLDVQREHELYQDMIFVPGGAMTDYRSIVYKTFAFVQVAQAASAASGLHCSLSLLVILPGFVITVDLLSS